MLLIKYRNVSDAEPGKSGEWRSVGQGVSFCIRDDEYLYETDRWLVLVDVVLDKTRQELVDDHAQRLIDNLENGTDVRDLFYGGYFVIVIDKSTGCVTVLRDVSGIKTGYIGRTSKMLVIGNNVHSVAHRCGVKQFDKEAVHQILYLNYTVDGYTLYDSIREVKIGQRIAFGSDLEYCEESVDSIPLADADNELDTEFNIAELREQTVRAHRKLTSENNVVLLSGGVDSAVMLASLHDITDGERLTALSYRVCGTHEDETTYAMSMADLLKIKCQVSDVDPMGELPFDDMDKTVLEMNNPYLGVWLFGQLDNASLNRTFFAGQDTRLHTPDLNAVDKFAFCLFAVSKIPVVSLLVCLGRGLTSLFKPIGLHKSRRRFLRGIGRALKAFDTRDYLLKYFFKVDAEAIAAEGISTDYIDRIKSHFAVDLGVIRNRRHLYNEIVRLKWREQYTDDIRYLQDLARLNGTYIAMPFYDPDLAAFSSGIPFNQATRLIWGQDRYSSRRVVVNKYVLRMAFKDKLSEQVFLRQKAVSSTLHQFFEGTLGREITKRLKSDLSSNRSFIRAYNLEPMVKKYLDHSVFGVDDQEFLARVYYVAMMCIYWDHMYRNATSSQDCSHSSLAES